MALTPEERQFYMDVLERTGKRRSNMLAQRVVPPEYIAWKEKVIQEEVTLTLPGVSVPVRCVISTAKEKKPLCPVHINMHGGGFIFPQDNDDDMYCAHIAAAIGGIVVDVDYATSDKHSFPVPFDQSYAVVKWAFEQCPTWNADPNRVSVGGHSAGGALATAVALKSVQTSDFKLCLLVLDFAANDNYMALEDPALERSAALSMLYADGADNLKDPYVSPAYASDEMLKGLPTTLIVAPVECPFYPVNNTLGMRIAAAGTEVTFKVFTESHHGFTVRLSGQWPEAQETIIRAIQNAGL